MRDEPHRARDARTRPRRAGYALRSCGAAAKRHRRRRSDVERADGMTRSCCARVPSGRSASASRRSSARRAMRCSAVTMSQGRAADTSVSADAADVACRCQWPSSPCASRSLRSSSTARRARCSERAINARRHIPILHETASASAGATSVNTTSRLGVSIGRLRGSRMRGRCIHPRIQERHRQDGARWEVRCKSCVRV
jgi:hypothetical protein